MKDDVTAPPAEGVYVYGLYLEGAGWDRRNMKLIDSRPKVLFEMMPVVRIYAENNSEYSAAAAGEPEAVVKVLFTLLPQVFVAVSAPAPTTAKAPGT